MKEESRHFSLRQGKLVSAAEKKTKTMGKDDIEVGNSGTFEVWPY